MSDDATLEREIYHLLLQDTLRNGIKNETRDGAALHRAAVTVSFDHYPRYRVRPGMSLGVLRAESLSLISGSAPADRICEIAPQLARFRDDYGVFSGMYGPRIAAQMPALLTLLADRPQTRQAVLSIFTGEDIAGELYGVRDTPCTTSLMFSRARERSELDVIAVMRSQDLWWGYPYDVLMFATLARTIARHLNCAEGTFTLFVANQHLYERHHGVARTLLRVRPKAWEWNAYVMGASRRTSWTQVCWRATQLLYGERPVGMDDGEALLLTERRTAGSL